MEPKELAFQAFREGWKRGHNVEELPPIAERTLETGFERWWNINMGDIEWPDEGYNEDEDPHADPEWTKNLVRGDEL